MPNYSLTTEADLVPGQLVKVVSIRGARVTGETVDIGTPAIRTGPRWLNVKPDKPGRPDKPDRGPR